MSAKSVIKTLIPTKLFRAIAPGYHLLVSVAAQYKYGFPAKKLKVVGVTGTDGKTTTATLIATMLRDSGYKTAVITTAAVDYGDGKGLQPNTTTNSLTTGDVRELTRMISKVANNDVQWLVLEVSSHALHQRRVWGIPFTLAVLTNMSPEHLDYHETFEKYRKAKELLFKQCNKNRQGLRTGIINADDTVAPHFKSDIANTVTYGIKNGEVRAREIKSSLAGNTFSVELSGTKTSITTHLVGSFNVYNALAAVAVGQAIGLAPEQIARGIKSLQNVPGRMMKIEEGQSFDVLIDYAVTPGALENVLNAVRDLNKKGRIHIVFGATGDRDKTKRPKMGEITAKLADYVYLTDDETYTEEPATIRAAVYAGVPKKLQDKVSEYDDRQDAIAAALKNAKQGDVVIISGIGHQTSRNMGGKKVPWSDIELTRKLLKK